MIQLFKDKVQGCYDFHPEGKLSGGDYVIKLMITTPPESRPALLFLILQEALKECDEEYTRYNRILETLSNKNPVDGAYDLYMTLSMRVEYSLTELSGFIVFLLRDVPKAFNVPLNEKIVKQELNGKPGFGDDYGTLQKVDNMFLRVYSETLREQNKQPGAPSTKKQLGKPAAKRGHKKRTGNFRALIQYGNSEADKDKLLKRLHYLIDGKSGIDVGSVLLNAWNIKGYLTKKPGKGDYESEFGPIDTNKWKAIAKYLDEGNNNALSRANQIILFPEED